MLPNLLAAVDTLETTAVDEAAAANAGAAIFGGFAVFMGVLILIGLAFFIFWIVMLIDVIKRTEEEFDQIGAQRSTWLIIMIVSVFVGLSWLAAILYYFMVKAKFKNLAQPTPTQPAQ